MACAHVQLAGLLQLVYALGRQHLGQQVFGGASGGSSWLLMGMHWPLILISAGAWADR
jgi:hypothetical protein